MKVDSKGQPVSEGTFGLYGHAAAKVVRAFVDPSKDDAATQRLIADGGYIVDTGVYAGELVSLAHTFTATYDGDQVIAQDGSVVGVGDTVELNAGGLAGTKNLVIKHLYPIGTLSGEWCASVEEHKGAAPDGHYGLCWGWIEKVVKKAGVKSTKLDPANIKVGDYIEYLDDSLKHTLCAEVVSWDKGHLAWRTELTKPCEELGLKEGTTYFAFSLKKDKKHLLKHVPKGQAEAAEPGEGWDTPAGAVYIGSTVRIVKPSVEVIGVIEEWRDSPSGVYAESTFKIRNTEVIKDKGSYAVGETGRYWPSRVTEIISQPEGVEDADIDTDQEQMEETDMSVETKPLNEKQRSQKFGAISVEREGTKIVLPVGMGLRTGIAELQRQAEQEEMDVAIMELIEGFPLDAAHAFVKALELKYGWVNALPTPGFFGPQPPTMIGVQVDPDGRTVQIPWGNLGIPGISGKLSTGIQFKDQRPVFCIGGTIKQKDKLIVSELAQMARNYLRENSLYKGKAIRVKFPEDPKAFSPLDNQPKFIQTADVKPEELIFSAGVEKQVRVNIWTPIRSLAAVRAARVPLKRGVLLYGRYGVGKTLLASVTARMAVQAGVTFIDMVDSKQLLEGVEFARMLGGMVVLFAEDIDVCDEELLKKVDGLTSKTDEVLIVYTTNHIERIAQAMLRQGRIDKVINIKEPDSEAAQRLVRLYARHMLHEDEDLTEVGALLSGFIPAAIREVVEQSKLAAIERGDVHHITAEDLKVTAENTREHMELLRPAAKDDRSELEKLGDAFAKRTVTTLLEAWEGDRTADKAAHEEPVLRSMIEEVTKRRVA